MTVEIWQNLWKQGGIHWNIGVKHPEPFFKSDFSRLELMLSLYGIATAITDEFEDDATHGEHTLVPAEICFPKPQVW